MVTLLQKWEEIDRFIKDKADSFLTDYFKDKEKPIIVYQIQGWKYIAEQTITEWTISEPGNWKPQYNKKPTKKDLQRLLEWHTRFSPKEENIFLHYTYAADYGKISGAHNLVKLKNDTRISFNKEDLVPILNELQAIYAPKDGHQACTYCGKQTPIEQMIDYTIIARQYPNMRKTSKYCSKICGANDQMAHEG